MFDAEGRAGARGDDALTPGLDSPAPRESQSKTVRDIAPLCIFQDVGWFAIQACLVFLLPVFLDPLSTATAGPLDRCFALTNIFKERNAKPTRCLDKLNVQLKKLPYSNVLFKQTAQCFPLAISRMHHLGLTVQA